MTYKKHSLQEVDMDAAKNISDSMKKDEPSIGDRLDNFLTAVQEWPIRQWDRGVSFLKDHKLHITAVIAVLVALGWGYDAYVGHVRIVAAQSTIEFEQAREAAAKAQQRVLEEATWFQHYFRNNQLREKANQAAQAILLPASQKAQQAGQKLEQTVTLGVFKELPPQ